MYLVVDETEAARSTSLRVVHQLHSVDRSELGEYLPDVALRGMYAETKYSQDSGRRWIHLELKSKSLIVSIKSNIVG